MLKAIAFGLGLPIRMVWPSPLLRATSAVPMVPPAPERFSTTTDWPQSGCKCAASSRPITSVEPPAAAGTMIRTVSDGRQSPAPRLARGRIAAADNAAAPDNTVRRENLLALTRLPPAQASCLRASVGDRLPVGQATNWRSPSGLIF